MEHLIDLILAGRHQVSDDSNENAAYKKKTKGKEIGEDCQMIQNSSYWISCEDLIYSMMAIVNNTVLCTWKL